MAETDILKWTIRVFISNLKGKHIVSVPIHNHSIKSYSYSNLSGALNE